MSDVYYDAESPTTGVNTGQDYHNSDCEVSLIVDSNEQNALPSTSSNDKYDQRVQSTSSMDTNTNNRDG